MKWLTQEELKWGAAISAIIALGSIAVIPYTSLEVGFGLIGMAAGNCTICIICIGILLWRAIKKSPTE